MRKFALFLFLIVTFSLCSCQQKKDPDNMILTGLEPSEQLLTSSSNYEKECGSPNDEHKERSMHLLNPPSINAHSVLGHVLFDACVPKNIEGWDIKFTGCLNGQPLATARRNSPSHNGKCIRRSKL